MSPGADPDDAPRPAAGRRKPEMEPTSSSSPPSPASPPSPSSPAEECGCRRVAALLERCEADPAFGRRHAEAVRLHLVRCESCDDRHGRRLAAIAGLIALHERTVPEGLLDDLYSTVRARAPYAPLGGGMSAAFLDGPRSLRLWRSTAAAAVVLLAVGGYWTLSAPRPSSAPAPVPLTDARDSLLDDFDAAASGRGARRLDPRFSTVAWPEHRPGVIWVPPVGPRAARDRVPRHD